jgi:3'(2'),5'-bisphosphate nucleotidase
MRKIAITQRLIENDSYHEVREALDISYCKMVHSCGFLPIVLPYEVDFKKYFDEFGIGGVILTGGNDLYICNKSELSEKRDDFEKRLLKYCIEKNIPVFGICRGMQIIAKYFGSNFTNIKNQVNIKHNLIIDENSKYKIYLEKLNKVNSFHNFGIDNLSDELIISATNENGIIKALEHKQYKIFGQMWHSERENPFINDEIALIKEFFNFRIEEIKNIASDAGEVVMNIYKEDIVVKNKSDDSPVTKADILANDLIKKRLGEISNYPIVTEESPIEYETRKNWKLFWLVDPLDGTKDFIAKNGDFTVNIALIENNEPILGVVFAPASKDIYYACKGQGAFKNGKKIFNSSVRKDLIGSDSNFHSTDMIKEFFNKYNIKKVKRFGSSIKLCKLAEGQIDVYPRLNGTKEWDTAASHIIANEAGCKLVDVETKKELVYNKENIKNNYFIASRNNLEFEI